MARQNEPNGSFEAMGREGCHLAVTLNQDLAVKEYFPERHLSGFKGVSGL